MCTTALAWATPSAVLLEMARRTELRATLTAPKCAALPDGFLLAPDL